MSASGGAGNISYNVLPIQTIQVENNEAATVIPTLSNSGQTAAGSTIQISSGQTLFTPSGQLIRAPPGNVVPTSLLQTVAAAGGQTIQFPGGANVSVRPAAAAAAPQVIQFPLQSTIPVQIPISNAAGQTVYQTVHFPFQGLSLPNVIQTSSLGQVQMVPQMPQLATAAPQMVQLLTPSGLQTVQLAHFAPSPQPAANQVQLITSQPNQSVVVSSGSSNTGWSVSSAPTSGSSTTTSAASSATTNTTFVNIPASSVTVNGAYERRLSIVFFYNCGRGGMVKK